jgi:serine/threonine-protein kinase HipA
MSRPERAYTVWLGTTRAGVIHQRGDHTRFFLAEEYRNDPDRPVLGLLFEQDLLRTHSAALRLPPWFSNLLPEGVLRDWIAADRGVSADREMELLAQVGHDLPGAVRVLPAGAQAPADAGAAGEPEPLLPEQAHPGWRFSLAGVQLKFSMLAEDDRLTLPAYGEGGDWIAKLPDRQYPDVPRNEFAMMSLADAAGIDVPHLRLVHRDQLSGLPARVWPGGEQWAYAVRRSDRADRRVPIHIEDLAQVTNVYPEQKYRGNYETVASLIYRRHDTAGLVKFARRLAFIVVIGNGDGHLKNWSLIYRDPRRPTLAPAYDLVSTAPYRVNGSAEDLGLKFGGSRLFHRVTLRLFTRLEKRLGATSVGLADHAADTARRTRDGWPRFEETLAGNPDLRRDIGEGIRNRAKALLASPNR